MRNHKFRLSDMIPNAWFYKLKEIGGGGGRARSSANNQTLFDSKKKLRQPPPPPLPSKQKQPQLPPQSHSRKSYYFTRELDNSPPPSTPPRKSLKQQKPVRRRTSSRSSSASTATATAKLPSSSSIWTKSDSPPEFSTSPSDGTSPEPEPEKILAAESKSFPRDIVIDLSSTYPVGNFDYLSELDLPPIITKHKKTPTKQRTTTATATSPIKKFPANSPGVRLRIHSPKISHRKITGRKSVSSRRSISESLAIMKSSYDPQKDFRESMMEMIVENNIKASKDLEELLACYLCLNADEYHELIIEVFKQIWFDLTMETL